jgi:hypothetical protein
MRLKADSTQRALDVRLDITRKRVNKHVLDFADGQIDALGFGDAMLETLTAAHAHAAYLGRYRAGDSTPPDQDDQSFADQVMRGEDTFLAGFEDDLKAGRYTGEDGTLKVNQIKRRAEMYVQKLQATANETWALTTGGNITWKLGHSEDHCPECPELAARSPYLWNALPTYPKAGETTCHSSCLCWLENEAGQESFR